jgi:hypothetical protein
MLNYGRRAMFGAICLTAMQLAACAGLQQYAPWSTNAQPASEASSAPSAFATPAPATAAGAVSPGGVAASVQEKRASQNAHRLASERASANALRASKQAALASKEPGARQEGANSPKSQGNTGTTTPPGAPVVTLGEAAPSSAGDAPSSTVDSPAPAAGATVASAEDDIHLQADRMIHDVSEEAKKIDSKSLDGDERRRETIALRLMKSAEKAYGDQDYSAAYSLAVKASVLLKPLPQTTSSASPER